MGTVQVLQSVQGMEELSLADACPPEPLEEVDLFDGEARLFTMLEHPTRQQSSRFISIFACVKDFVEKQSRKWWISL